MGSIYLRKYGVATTVDFSLYKLDGTGLKTDAASASGDVTLNRDEAAEEQLDADAFVDEGKSYSLELSAAEMTAARIMVHIIDQSETQVWLDKTLIIETYGNASAQHAFDLDTATQDVNLTQIGGVAQSATDLKDLVDTGYNPATHKVQGVVLCDTTTTNTDLTAFAANYTAARAAYLDELAAANLPTDVANVKAETALIVADTNELQTDWKNGGRLDLLIDAIKAITDTLVIAGIADAIHDEVVEGTTTLRQAVRLLLSHHTGKCSGGGTNTLVFRDIGDTKDRLTYTVNAVGDRSAVARDGA
jgi:hypothetical protein